MTTEQLMFSCIRAAICGSDESETLKEQLSAEAAGALYTLAKSHDLAHVVAETLGNGGLLDDGVIAQKFQKQQMLAVYRYQRLNYELQALGAALEEAQIDFVPLKGAVLRPYYPEPWMRTSCDIDVLVHEEDLERAIEVLTDRLECKKEGRSTHDVSLVTASGIHIELHYSLLEEGRAADANDILSHIWDYTAPDDGCTYRRHMSDAAFYFYHIAHMAKHFERGGCGVRPFIDLWLLDRREGDDPNERNTLLQRGGLLTFAEAARGLACAWMRGENAEGVARQLGDYILRAGVYGDTETKVILGQAKTGGRFRYIMGRIFPPLSYLKSQYPILKKHAWLVPICYVRRWGRLVFLRRAGHSVNELRASGSFSADQKKNAAGLLENLGL